MKIPENVASSLQDVLYLTSLDGYCPDTFLGGRPSRRPKNAQVLWKNSVDLIYRCLACDFLKLDTGWAEAMQISSPEVFAMALSQHDPFDQEDFIGCGAIYWLDPLLYATEATKKLLTQYEINDLGMNPCIPFSTVIAETFDKRGVPWGSDLKFLTS